MAVLGIDSKASLEQAEDKVTRGLNNIIESILGLLQENSSSLSENPNRMGEFANANSSNPYVKQLQSAFEQASSGLSSVRGKSYELRDVIARAQAIHARAVEISESITIETISPYLEKINTELMEFIEELESLYSMINMSDEDLQKQVDEANSNSAPSFIPPRFGQDGFVGVDPDMYVNIGVPENETPVMTLGEAKIQLAYDIETQIKKIQDKIVNLLKECELSAKIIAELYKKIDADIYLAENAYMELIKCILTMVNNFIEEILGKTVRDVSDLLYQCERIVYGIMNPNDPECARELLRILNEVMKAMASLAEQLASLGIPKIPVIGDLGEFLKRIGELVDQVDTIEGTIESSLSEEEKAKRKEDINKFVLKLSMSRKIVRIIQRAKDLCQFIIENYNVILILIPLGLVIGVINFLTEPLKKIGIEMPDLGKLFKLGFGGIGSAIDFRIDKLTEKLASIDLSGGMDLIELIKVLIMIVIAGKNFPDMLMKMIETFLKQIKALQWLLTDGDTGTLVERLKLFRTSVDYANIGNKNACKAYDSGNIFVESILKFYNKQQESNGGGSLASIINDAIVSFGNPSLDLDKIFTNLKSHVQESIMKNDENIGSIENFLIPKMEELGGIVPKGDGSNPVAEAESRANDIISKLG